MKAKRGLKNIAANYLSQIVTLVLGLLIPQLVMVNLGSESNGLLQSVTNVLAYLAVLEAGIGTASLQALYSPVSKDDKGAINRVVSATGRFFRKVGLIYLGVVIVLAVVFPFTIKSELSYTTIMLTVLLTGLPSVVNYCVQSKYRILLEAEGKQYVVTYISTAIHFVTSFAKIGLLLFGFGIVALQAAFFVLDALKTVILVIYIRRRYKWLDLSAEPDYQAISKSRNVLVHQISGLIFNHTDTLLLTWIKGLAFASVYETYRMLCGMIDTAVGNLFGVDFILGQTYNSDREKYMKLHNVYELYIMTFSFSLFCVTAVMILPFMKLYVAEVKDAELYIDPRLPLLFVVTYLLSKGRTACMQAINVAQKFKETEWHAIVEMVINVVVTVAAVYLWGIYGALIGTVAALLFRTNAMIIYANRVVLQRSPWVTYRRWLLNIALFTGLYLAGNAVVSRLVLDGYLKIVLCAAVMTIVVIPVFFAVVSLFDRPTCRYALSLLKPLLSRFRKNSSGT